MSKSRSYHSPRRRQEAANTRQAILDAALRLFADHGYDRVTVAEIARRAEVATKTVYASVGGKPELLKEVISTAVGRSHGHEAMERIRGCEDPRGIIELVAQGTRRDNEQNRDLLEATHAAMSAHQEEAQAFWERTTTLYRDFLAETAVRLDDLRALPQNMSADEAAEILWFCFGISAWRTVVQEFGLGWDQAQEWLLRRAVVLLQGE
ncbi:TetR/AcrR family transcriptional regulator [Nocardiopsis alkaliphila]|uniref:TetR/AcrR family transcriptional regulator n=1 Tax=Nocardiopsis alkaliphila TaxID=225762 RepID=UPI000344AABC|nr:TetR/AcrR family transcriptional regulator [Nocardiopsis alkaliphila]